MVINRQHRTRARPRGVTTQVFTTVWAMIAAKKTTSHLGGWMEIPSLRPVRAGTIMPSLN
jgi:hypothetical protein